MSLFGNRKRKPGPDGPWPERDRVIPKVEAFVQKLNHLPQQPEYGTLKCNETEFILMLGALAACHRVPGLDGTTEFDTLPVCHTEEAKRELINHFEMIYGIYDEDSLLYVCEDVFSVQSQVRHFQSFWDGLPIFDERRLSKKGLRAFQSARAYADGYRKFVGRRGFFAWDISERIGLMRNAAACGMITEESFWNHARPLAQMAVSCYRSWQEYAISCLCGGLYFMFYEANLKEGDVEGFCDIYIKLLEYLMLENGVWSKYEWKDLERKRYHLAPTQMRQLLQNWKEEEGCIATDRVTVDGCKIGYMYRETPLPDTQDSGWRFFAGDEDREYTGDPEKSEIYSLNTICNYDPEILPLLYAPVGTAYVRDVNGQFQEEVFQMEA